MPKKKAAASEAPAPKIDAPPENPPAPAHARAPRARKAAPAKESTTPVDNSWKQLLIVAAFAAAGLWLVGRKGEKLAPRPPAPAVPRKKDGQEVSAGAAIAEFIAKRSI